MSNDLSKRAKEIISRIQYVTVATVTEDGTPWNSPVFTSYDEDYNFYWGTHKDSQKAKNIRFNNNVFLVIYDSTVPSGTGEGVYIKAVVEELAEPNEVSRVFNLLKTRHATSFWDFAAVQEDGPIRLYKAMPQQVWMNDGGKVGGHYIDTRTEIILYSKEDK
jgi:uncharacterized protein YhbP (UPF0306 family)